MNVILATPGNKEGEMPELVFSRFYNCTREAKIGKDNYFLRINIKRKDGEQEHQDVKFNPDDRISIPVPLENIEGISVFSGMNPCEDLLKAYSDRLDLKASIEAWTKVIVQRTELHAKKQAAFMELPEIEEVPEIESEAEETVAEAEEENAPETTEVDEPVASEETAAETTEEVAPEATEENADEVTEENADEATEENEPEETEENATEASEQTDETKIDEEAMEVEEQKRKEEEEEKLQLAEKKKEEKERKVRERLEALKKREQAIKKRGQAEAAIEKLAASVERAKESLANERQKLEDLTTNFGQWLAYFQDEVNEDEAVRCFQDELKEGLEKPTTDVEMVEPTAEIETEGSNVEQAEMEIGGSNDEEQAAEPMEEDDVEQAAEAQETEVSEGTESKPKVAEDGVCSSCGTACAGEKFCNECGANQETQKQEATKEDDGEVTDTPVWISILLKKPLDKFYASALKNLICEKEVLEKASLILLKYNPKYKTKIVLKNVSYPGTKEHINLLNQVVKGPWKSIRKNASELLNDRSPYTLEKIVHYLAKTHLRQEVLDNLIDSCNLCERTIKRMYMDKHMTQFCLKRQEPCGYCEEALVFEKMEEHHQTNCPKFPVDCPLKCLEKHARGSIEEHLKTCMNASVQCEFYSHGCKADLKRKQVPQHMTTSAIEHVKLLRAQLMFVSSYLAERDPALTELMNPTSPTEEDSGAQEKNEGDMHVD